MDWLAILEGAVRASRTAAIITGTLVTVDSIAVMLDQRARPPRPHVSALAWLIAGLVVSVVGSFLISQRVLFLSDLSRHLAAVAAILFWGGLAASFTTRAIARAERPWLTFGSFVGMMAFGTALAVAWPL